MKYFKISKWRILVGLIIMCLSEFISIKILTMPYVELEANADKYHPIVAYMFFGPIALLLAILIIINVVFYFQKGKGLHLTSTGIIDNSTPFSMGEIPFERIMQICNVTNKVTKFRFIKIRENEISVHLRRRKVDKLWWDDAHNGVKIKLIKWSTRNGFYNISTKIFSASHDDLVRALEKHIELEPRVKMYSMDVEQHFKDLAVKRKTEKESLKNKKD
jgi:hypothetical protein